MRVTSEGIHSSINIRYFELNDIPYIIHIFARKMEKKHVRSVKKRVIYVLKASTKASVVKIIC